MPEIASRKHIEAICGVCDECFEAAAEVLGVPQLTWHDLDAVGVTYAPGLLGALVVGVAFAKGAAWAADKPLIGVHHLEGATCMPIARRPTSSRRWSHSGVGRQTRCLA